METAEQIISKLNLEKIGEPEIYQVTVHANMDATVALELYYYFQEKKEVKELRMLTIMQDFEGFKQIREFLESIAVDKIKNGKMTKNAIVSDTKWVEKIVKREDSLINRIPIRFFSIRVKDEAIEWLKEN